MADDNTPRETRRQPPFHSLTFMYFKPVVGRSLFRMKEQGDGMYELHVEQGSAANGTHFTRHVPQKTAQALKDALDQAGVFGWREAYPQQGDARWSLNVVFKEGVFSQSSKGGDETPEGFDAMLEQFYELDFPRPEHKVTPSEKSAGSAEGFAGLNLQDLDPSNITNLLSQAGMDPYAIQEMQNAFETLQRDPAQFQTMMRTEFSSMPPEQQNSLLDLLAATGMASRAWWERFLRG